MYLASPIPLPCTVTLADPVPAPLARRITLILPPDPPMLHPSVTDPPLSPAVTDTRRVPIDPCAIWHLIDVSDSHSVASHAVCPTRVPAV